MTFESATTSKQRGRITSFLQNLLTVGASASGSPKALEQKLRSVLERIYKETGLRFQGLCIIESQETKSIRLVYMSSDQRGEIGF